MYVMCFVFRAGPGEQVTILLRCPAISSCLWCVRLYSLVFAGCSCLFSVLWIGKPHINIIHWHE